MKLLIIFSIVLPLAIYSMKSYADESQAIQTEHKNQHSDIVTKSSPVSLLLITQDLVAVIDSSQPLEVTTEIKGEFTTRLLSMEAGILQSKQASGWNKYYFQGAVTLHQQNEFNVSLMANIEQINNFNHHNDQTPILDNSITLNETELNYSFGIITSYSVSPTWHFSGGIIHAESLNETTKNTWYGDTNMALIGTTYSF